jgi:hypothetical protein
LTGLASMPWKTKMAEQWWLLINQTRNHNVSRNMSHTTLLRSYLSSVEFFIHRQKKILAIQPFLPFTPSTFFISGCKGGQWCFTSYTERGLVSPNPFACNENLYLVTNVQAWALSFCPDFSW